MAPKSKRFVIHDPRCGIRDTRFEIRDPEARLPSRRMVRPTSRMPHLESRIPHPASRTPYPASRCGFTLIEVLAVVVVLAILASVAMFSVSGHVQHARLIRTADRLESLDRRARDEARRQSAPGQLLWDTRQGVAQIAFARAEDSPVATRRVSLGGGLEFSEFRIDGARGLGRQVVDVSPNGQSDTYAVRLSAPNGAALWLVTLGLTGQHLRLDSEDDVRALLAP